jgi:hypothetical protein
VPRNKQYFLKAVRKADMTLTDTRIRRFEQKLVIQPRFVAFVKRWLHHACIVDPVFPANPVFSIYFDTPALDSYHECLNGDVYKNKVRLRWYQVPVAGQKLTAYIEIKSKAGFGTDKRRRAVPLEGAELLPANLTALIRKLALERVLPEMGWLPPGQLGPVVIISYRRQRFREPTTGLSVTYDTDISSRPVGPRFPCRVSGMTLHATVLELKGGTTVLPRNLYALKQAGPRWSAFSKYARCVESHLAPPDSADWWQE